MGIYYDRGVEYRIYKSRDDFVVVLPMKQLDSRLSQSEYFLTRRGDWFNPSATRYTRHVPRKDLDIELYEVEKERIKEALKAAPDRLEAGFYIVTATICTLDVPSSTTWSVLSPDHIFCLENE